MDTERNTAYRLYSRLPRSVLHTLFFLPWLLILCWMAALSWWLTDDAFISFRYARNLLEGHGLVFNPGERVEGYTNFLWTLELAGIWGLFGVRPEHSAHWLSVLFTAGTLAAMLYWVVRMPSLRHRGLVAWMSLGLVCCSATFAVWTSAGGLETRQFTFFVAAAVALLAVHRGSRAGLLSASFSLGLASLTRPEGLLIAGCCIGWFMLQSMGGASIHDSRGAGGGRSARAGAVLMQMLKRIDWRGVACLVLPFALMVGAHFLFRWLYYGELLPNTYHAKFVRPWWDMGLRYYTAAGLETGLYILAPLAATGAWLRWKSHRDSIYALVLLFIALHTFYVMRLGGDSFEWRMLDFYWPLLAVPAAEVIALLGMKLASGVKGILPALSRFSRFAPAVFTLFVFALVLFYSSAMQFALLLRGDETDTLAGTPRVRLDRREARWLFGVPGMSLFYRVNEDLRAKMTRHSIGWKSVKFRQVYKITEMAFRPYEGHLRGKMPKDAVMGIGMLGLIGYYLADMTIIDFYGLTDKTVAHNPVLRSNDERRMAHDRVPPYGYLDQRGVNISILRAARSEDEALDVAGYALRLDEDLWMPFNAIDHQWVQDRFGGPGLASDRDGASAIDVMNNLVGDRDPEIRSGFYDVHIVGDNVVYAKSPCIWDDVHERGDLYLHLASADGSHLSPEGRFRGFDSLDLSLLRNGGRVGDRCIVRADLLGYEVASIRTGQLARAKHEAWSAVYSFVASESIDELAKLRRKGIEPAIDSDFEVFVDDGRLIYHKRPCSSEEINARFFLHLHPNDVDDLPQERREFGFDNFDFSLWWNGGRVGDECVARVGLPDYEISEIRTGQLAHAKHEAWSAVYSFVASESIDELAKLRRKGIEPAIDSDFEVFVDDGRLIYHKRPCSSEEINARFFLHLHPNDVDDLPPDRIESGFDNLDFSLWRVGGIVGDECAARVDLPGYEIASIRTGQFTPEGSIWEASIKIDEVPDARSR